MGESITDLFHGNNLSDLRDALAQIPRKTVPQGYFARGAAYARPLEADPHGSGLIDVHQLHVPAILLDRRADPLDDLGNLLVQFAGSLGIW